MKKQKTRMNLVFVSLAIVLLMVSSILAVSEIQNGSDGGGSGVVGSVTGTNEQIQDTAIEKAEDVVIDGESVLVYPIDISPSRQITEDGTATYKIVFADPHKPESSVCGYDIVSGLATPCPVAPSFKYSISFESGQKLSGEFSEIECFSTFTGGRVSSNELRETDPGPDTGSSCKISPVDGEFVVGAGQTKVFQLNVKTDERGTHTFAVVIKGQDADVSAVGKGTLIYPENIVPPKPEEKVYFIGNGYILSEDKNIGHAVNLKIFDYPDIDVAGRLAGKAAIGSIVYGVKGGVVGSSVSMGVSADLVKFNIISLENGNVLAVLQGNVYNYGEFKLFKGNVDGLERRTWEFMAISQREHIEEVSVGVSREIGIKETIVVGSQESTTVAQATLSSQGVNSEVFTDSGIYIKPVEVKTQKILWIIPAGKAVEIEVVKGDKVLDITIGENSNKEVEGYRVSVGAITEASAEIKVEKA